MPLRRCSKYVAKATYLGQRLKDMFFDVYYLNLLSISDLKPQNFLNQMPLILCVI